MAASAAARTIVCELQSQKPAVAPLQRVRSTAIDSSSDQMKIVLQPRLCTLRSYASDRGSVIRTRKVEGGDRVDDLSPFLANLYDYIESTKKSQDFEIITGRLAMIVFAVTVGAEAVTGNSIFSKVDLLGLEEGAGACLAAVVCAAIFAWSSSARGRVGRMFTVGCNTFIDALIDKIVDGLFYESELEDWIDEI